MRFKALLGKILTKNRTHAPFQNWYLLAPKAPLEKKLASVSEKGCPKTVSKGTLWVGSGSNP